jgi:tetratricopeptide (TPR) repeat protein
MDLAAGEGPIEAALKLDPQCYDAHLFAGYIALGQRRYHDSIRHFETAMALEADAYRPAGMVVQAYEAIGDEEGALKAARRSKERCEKLLRFEPDHSGALGFFVNALVDLGETERAQEWTKRAVLFDPDNMRLHYNLACGMAKVDAEAACELLEGIVPRVSEVDGDRQQPRSAPGASALQSAPRVDPSAHARAVN